MKTGVYSKLAGFSRIFAEILSVTDYNISSNDI